MPEEKPTEGKPKEEKEELEVEGTKHREEKEKPKEKKVEKKGKRIRRGRKHESVKPQKFYEIQGNKLIRKRTSCPRCGPGIWLAKHKDRNYCGRCGWTEFKT